MKKRMTAIVAGILLACSVLSACQPTPEVAPVVNKRDQVITDKAAGEEQPADTQPHYNPVEFKVLEHWQEQIVKDEFFTANVDADVMVPDVEQYPVQKLERLTMTQERADELIGYFVEEGVKFYHFPMPRTKDSYEQQIIELKQSLAEVEAGGDGEDPESIRQYIQEMEEKMATAPEENTEEYADTKFTYMRDYETGAPLEEEGENFINLAADNGDGILTVYAGRSGGEGKTSAYSDNFSFSTHTMDVETYYEQEMFWIEDGLRQLETMEEPYKSDYKKQLDDQIANMEERQALFDRNTLDADAMREKAVKVLEDLGIEGVQITTTGRALLKPNTEDMWEPYRQEWEQPKDPGYHFELMRECGGVPCKQWPGGSVPNEEDMAGQTFYSAPFEVESGTITLDADGNVVNFMWYGGAKMVEQVAADGELLDFETIKKRAIDQLYWMNSYYYEKDPEAAQYRPKLRFEINSAELRMGYINAKDDPERVLIVPVWHIGSQGWATFKDEDGTERESMWNGEEVKINALDGTVVLMPGLNRMWEENAKWEAEMAIAEAEGGDAAVVATPGAEPVPAAG